MFSGLRCSEFGQSLNTQRADSRPAWAKRKRQKHADKIDERPAYAYGWRSAHKWNEARSGNKKIVSYLPERTYLNDWMSVQNIIDFFGDFYADFSKAKAYDMLQRLHINPNRRIKTLSKGTKEKVQLILVMSREAQLYILDEPIGGVDPAARDYILDTIISNYSKDATLLISTHLISDIEKILDGVVFINMGNIVLTASVDKIREKENKSVDEFFREVFRC